MAIVKSFAVGEGDMFYIKHDNKTLTIIDCCLSKSDEKKEYILEELKNLKDIDFNRFILTHPHDDHTRGFEDLTKEIKINNIYRTIDQFIKQKKNLNEKTSSPKILDLFNNITNSWFNKPKGSRGSSNLECLWPDKNNPEFLDAKKNGDWNNVSPVIRFVDSGYSFIWFGDLEIPMLEEFFNQEKDIISPTDIVFAPHHGRESGKIPDALLKKLNPQLIVIGEIEDKDDIADYGKYKTISRANSGDITFYIENGKCYIFTENKIVKTEPVIPHKIKALFPGSCPYTLIN